MPTLQHNASTLFTSLALAVLLQPGQLHADPPPTIETRELLVQLGSAEFAVRERAADGLTNLGNSIVPQLRELLAKSNDPEVKLRAGQIIKQVTDGDLASQIDLFLAGGNAKFAGWPITRRVLGDNGAIRELFVQLMSEHPDIIASLGQTTRDRAVALEKSLVGIQNKMFKQRKFPSQADTFALLLPTIDPGVPVSKVFERVMLSVLQKEAATKIRNDAQLSGPFKGLLTQWIVRCRWDNRDLVLLFTMDWDMETGLPVAVETLTESDQPRSLAVAMQTVARFGGLEQVEFVVPFLDNKQPVEERGFVRGKEVIVRVGDVAMATIARLYNVELSELGFPKSADHLVRSFLIAEIGFPADDKESRIAARKKIDLLLQKKRSTANKASANQ